MILCPYLWIIKVILKLQSRSDIEPILQPYRFFLTPTFIVNQNFQLFTFSFFHLHIIKALVSLHHKSLGMSHLLSDRSSFLSFQEVFIDLFQAVYRLKLLFFIRESHEKLFILHIVAGRQVIFISFIAQFFFFNFDSCTSSYTSSCSCP